MFHNMKVLVIFYGVFAVTQLIKAEVTYSYTLPRDELLPVMRKLDKFADCNKNATITNDYEFVFTIDRPTSTCGSDSILQKESFTNFIAKAITKPIYFLTTNQGKTNYPTCVDSINKKTTTPKSTNPQTVNTKIINPQTINTKIINPQTINPKSTNPKKTINEKNPPLKKPIDYPPNPVGITTKAPPEKITTLNPIQEQLMKEKKERNNYLATIITAVLVGLMVFGVVGCAIAKYAKTVRQSGAYVVDNP